PASATAATDPRARCRFAACTTPSARRAAAAWSRSPPPAGSRPPTTRGQAGNGALEALRREGHRGAPQPDLILRVPASFHQQPQRLARALGVLGGAVDDLAHRELAGIGARRSGEIEVGIGDDPAAALAELHRVHPLPGGAEDTPELDQPPLSFLVVGGVLERDDRFAEEAPEEWFLRGDRSARHRLRPALHQAR